MIPVGQIKTSTYKQRGLSGAPMGQSMRPAGKHETEIVFGHVVIALLVWHFGSGFWALVYFTFPFWLLIILYPFVRGVKKGRN